MAPPLSLRWLLVVWALWLGWGQGPGRGWLPRLSDHQRQPPTAQPAPTGCAREGTLEDIAVPTSYLPGREIQARIYLPPCYDPQARPGYPLLVLIHGQGYTPQQWLDLNLPARADALIARGEIPPLVVLMPYDPPPAMRPPNTGFDEAFLEDLLPWVDRHYALRPEREFRAIGGISRGAAWAIHFGLLNWSQFGAIGGHSPPVFWSDGLQIPNWLAAIPPEQWPRIYLDIGDGDRQEILTAATDFEALLTDMGVPHEWHFNVGRHEQAYWNAHLDDYLRWYAAPWQPSAPATETPP